MYVCIFPLHAKMYVFFLYVRKCVCIFPLRAKVSVFFLYVRKENVCVHERKCMCMRENVCERRMCVCEESVCMRENVCVHERKCMQEESVCVCTWEKMYVRGECVCAWEKIYVWEENVCVCAWEKMYVWAGQNELSCTAPHTVLCGSCPLSSPTLYGLYLFVTFRFGCLLHLLAYASGGHSAWVTSRVSIQGLHTLGTRPLCSHHVSVLRCALQAMATFVKWDSLPFAAFPGCVTRCSRLYSYVISFFI